jgi:hypothetical protein
MSAAQSGLERGYTPGSGLPLAPPLGSSGKSVTPLVEGALEPLGELNTSSSADVVVPARRVSARALDRLSQQLSDRDRIVLSRLLEHGYLTTHQIEGFAFSGHATPGSASRATRRVLARLDRDGLVRTVGRRVGGVRAGSAATVWRLAPAGVRLLREAGARIRKGEPSVRHLAHTLAVADVHLLLRDHERIEAIESVTVQVESAAWRPYHGAGGERRWLQPDLYAEITTSDFVDRIFLEVDLGSEGMATLLDKCRQYEAYRASGSEQQQGSFPLVIWLFLTPDRARALSAAVSRSPRLSAEMFRYATPDTLTQVVAGGAP